MYVSHQALRILARERMTSAEQREADAQLGRIVAALARSGRRFRKVGQAGSPPGAGISSLTLSQGTRKDCLTQRRPAPAGARR
jgi:hypothetical protein